MPNRSSTASWLGYTLNTEQSSIGTDQGWLARVTDGYGSLLLDPSKQLPFGSESQAQAEAEKAVKDHFKLADRDIPADSRPIWKVANGE